MRLKPKEGVVIPPDLMEALELLSSAGPNPLLIIPDDYWDRYEKLTEKYLKAD